MNKNKEKRNRTIQTKQGNNYNTVNVVSYTRVYQRGYQEAFKFSKTGMGTLSVNYEK